MRLFGFIVHASREILTLSKIPKQRPNGCSNLAWLVATERWGESLSLNGPLMPSAEIAAKLRGWGPFLAWLGSGQLSGLFSGQTFTFQYIV
jgi:hypothetical protein